MLAARTLLDQDIEVVGITFISSFFGAKRGLEAAKKLGIPLIAFNIAEKHLAMVKSPKNGYGKNMNPCIDCHAMMLAEAKEIMEGKEVVWVYPDGRPKAVAQKFDFVATGEVLGQRPMSQNPRALKLVAKIADLEGLLVRPLCAKLLDVTTPEKEGKIDRERLLDINGRSRSRQVELAAHYNITDYPSPAGGCLLTVPEYSDKLYELFQLWPNCENIDAELIKQGRVHWMKLNDEPVLLVVARDEAEGTQLEKLAKIGGGTVIDLVDVLGPTAVLKLHGKALTNQDFEIAVEVPRELKVADLPRKFTSAKEMLDFVALLVGYYSTKARGLNIKVEFKVK